MKAEIAKLRDKEWRVNHLYSIVDKRQQQVRFKQNAIQRAIFRTKNHRKQILKARQFGVSTNEIVDLFDDTIWKPNQTTGIIAHEKDAIVKLFRIVQRAWRFLPEDSRPVIDKGGGSKYEMFFPEINSRIYCDLEIRSDTISRLLVSEAAFFEDQNKLLASLQAVPLWCPITLESTPNGVDNIFYEWWNDPTSSYAKLFYPWYIFPEYRLDNGIPVEKWTHEEREFAKKAAGSRYPRTITPEQMAFRRYKKSELRELYIQEFPEDDQTCFLSSGKAAFDLILISEMLKRAPDPIRETPTTKFYKMREPRELYAIGVDTSEGTGGDYSVAQIFKIRNREQVAIVRANKTKPSDFAEMVCKVAREYEQPGRILPEIAVERNNHGHSVIQHMEEQIKWPKLYRHTDDKLGWLTDRVTRPIMLDTFIQGVENSSVKLVDRLTLRECLTLVENEGKIEAGQGKTDDAVLAGAIGVQLSIARAGSVFMQTAEEARARIIAG